MPLERVRFAPLQVTFVASSTAWPSILPRSSAAGASFILLFNLDALLRASPFFSPFLALFRPRFRSRFFLLLRRSARYLLAAESLLGFFVCPFRFPLISFSWLLLSRDSRSTSVFPLFESLFLRRFFRDLSPLSPFRRVIDAEAAETGVRFVCCC